ncbi:hypothetical protein UlMin_014336 [Ulmus minor]
MNEKSYREPVTNSDKNCVLRYARKCQKSLTSFKRRQVAVGLVKDRVAPPSPSLAARKFRFERTLKPESSKEPILAFLLVKFSFGQEGMNCRIGKTYTMAGTKADPGLMVLSLHTIFDQIQRDKSSDGFEVTCSYLEVYNEVIYDLVKKSSGHLELREDPEHGITVAGLRCIKSVDKILELLNLGNSRRKLKAQRQMQHPLGEKQKNKYRNQVMRGKLALVDLASSERASETNSGGQKLRDGANINRSLLALANCINALGKQHKKGLTYVLYRNSKLTRILKDGLSVNSQTVMVATISPADNQYHHTVNILKYADRAKEIKTHIQKNIGTIDTHVSDYQRMIDSLQKELADKESQLSVKPAEKAADDELSWLNILSHETGENVQERINLQKALHELEETNLRNCTELQHLDEAIANKQLLGHPEINPTRACPSCQHVIDNSDVRFLMSPNPTNGFIAHKNDLFDGKVLYNWVLTRCRLSDQICEKSIRLCSIPPPKTTSSPTLLSPPCVFRNINFYYLVSF